MLWLSMLFMMAGMNMQMVVRGVLAYDLTNSALVVGIVSAGMAPPIFFLSLFGGAIADRVDRRRLIQIGQFGMAINSGIIALLIHVHVINAWDLVLASVAQGILFAFMMPARQSIIPRLVGDRLTTNALALNATGMSMMTLAAPGVGGLVYGVWGPGAAYDMIAGFNVIALVFSSMLPAVVATGKRKNVTGEMKAAFGYVIEHRIVLALLIIGLGTSMVANPARSLLPVYVEGLFKMGPGAVGLMLSVFGGGAFIGSIFIAGLRKGQRRGLVLIAATTLSGTSVVLLSFAPVYAVAVAIMLFMGLADSGRRALNNALIMEETEDDYRGRVSGIWMMNFGLMPLGVLPVSAAAEYVGVRPAYLVAGAILLAFGLWFLFANRRVREL